MFSTAFDPISQWQYVNQSSMSEHLKVLPNSWSQAQS